MSFQVVYNNEKNPELSEKVKKITSEFHIVHDNKPKHDEIDPFYTQSVTNALQPNAANHQ